MIAPDGYPYLAFAGAATVAAAFLYWPLALVVFALFLFLVNFFRDPERNPASDDPRDVISPADGVVIRSGETGAEDRPPACADLPVYLSIFMNVLDVHVNRSPLDGTIVVAEHRGGLKLAADHERARLENERNLVRLDTAYGPIVFVQVAGLLARRIVFRRKVGDAVGRGERVGMIKFGSRVDLYFPAGTKLLVAPGDRCFAGRSAIAHYPQESK